MAMIFPSEILFDIFSALKGLSDSPALVDVPNKSWLLGTHVCRFWRQAALGSPLLWRYIRISGTRKSDIPYLRMSLERSRNTLVHIVVSSRTLHIRGRSSLMDVIQASAARIAVLDLLPDNGGIHSRLNFSMPKLEVLTLSGGRYSTTWPQLTADNLPRLRRLTLDGALAPSQSMPLGLQSGRWPYIDELLATINSCTSLEVLALHDVVPKLKWWLIGNQPRQLAHLPTVRTLDFQGTLTDLTTLMTHLAPRAPKLISLCYRHSRLGQNNASHAEQVVRQALRLFSPDRASPVEVERLVLRLERHDRGPAARMSCYIPNQASPCVVVHIDVATLWRRPVRPVDVVEFESLLLHSLKGVSSPTLQEVDIEYTVLPRRMGALSSRQWMEVFRRLPTISRLTIAGPCASILLSELEISPGSPRPAACPDLRHLTLRSCTYDTTIAGALRSTITSRRNGGRPLETLTLQFRSPYGNKETVDFKRDIQEELNGSLDVDNLCCLFGNAMQEL